MHLRSSMFSRLIVLCACVAVVLSGVSLTASARKVGKPVKGKNQAYHGVVVKRIKEKKAPKNRAAHYGGPWIQVQAVDVGRESAEPTIGVTKDGAAFFAAGAFDAANGLLARTEVLRSEDGGLSWESVQAEVAGNDTPPTTLDPYVYVEEDTSRIFNIELYVGCAYLNFSDDNGDTWTQNPAACGNFVNDHQTLSAGPPPEGVDTLGFEEIVYYCFNRVADSSCGRSLDGGLTWTPTTPAFTGSDPDAGGFCGGLHGHVVTDHAGRVFIPKGHCNYPWLAFSEDAGLTWQRVQISNKVESAGIHTSIIADREDNLYYVWWDRTHRLPFLSISRDHGRSWSKARMIAPPGVKETNFPTIAAGDKGRIVLQFPGTSGKRDDSTRSWNSYYVVSTNALSKNPLFVSTTANPVSDPIHRGNCGPGRCAGMFDFLDVIVSPHDGNFWGATTDTCTDENFCNNAEAKGPATAADGVAVRQLAGPSLWNRR